MVPTPLIISLFRINAWVIMSTVTWRCAHMCVALSRTASPCCVSCAASVTLSLRQSSSRSSLLWSSAVWTMVTVRWLSLPFYVQRRLQSVQKNAASRLIFRPHHRGTSQFTLITCAGAHYLQGCRLDVPCSDRRRTTVSAAVRLCR